jgi:hydrogenase-4 component B
MSERLVLLGSLLAAGSGLPGLCLSRHGKAGQWVTTALAVIAAGLGLVGTGLFWVSGSQPIHEPWSLIPGAAFDVAVDGLSAVFLVPIFLIFLVGSIYGLEYWPQTEHADNGRTLRLFYGLAAAGMALVVIARNSILFLFGWEIMALSAFFLVSTEDQQPEVRQAAWIYLVAAHTGTLALFGLFALLHGATGSFALVPLDEEALPPAIGAAIFVCALVGFGLKAGLMPLHVWLPSAHAIAPSHVSALMSGVIIKMGIYGIARILSLVPDPPLAWGGIVLGLGVVSGVLGVAFAIGQHDLKRLLAYHSIENIGIIAIGLGLALIGRSLQQPGWVVLGLCGGLLHVWNHALFKALLFLCAGSVIHSTHTREIDHLGGLAKRMPLTSLGFLLGAVAICGLPPLNGFVSEFLIYLGLFGTLGLNQGEACPAAALAAPALALIGALAVACFVKAFGVVFLGTPRSGQALQAHESGWAMVGPVGVLVVSCVFIGLVPTAVVPLVARAVPAWAPEVSDVDTRLATLAPLTWISALAFGLVAAMVLGGLFLWVRLRGSVVTTGPTWDCGYARPTPRMQYTASSFAQMLVALARWFLRPRTHRPGTLALFPQPSSFHSEVPETVLDEGVLPAFRWGARLLAWFRVFQQGSIQAYLLYLFLALLGLLLWR